MFGKIVSGIVGTATTINPKNVEVEYERILGGNERVECAYRLIRDLIIITDKRLIHVNKQGITGKKTTYCSVMFHHIHMLEIESAGHFDLDAELRVWVSGHSEPLSFEFSSGTNIYEAQQVIISHM